MGFLQYKTTLKTFYINYLCSNIKASEDFYFHRRCLQMYSFQMIYKEQNEPIKILFSKRSFEKSILGQCQLEEGSLLCKNVFVEISTYFSHKHYPNNLVHIFRRNCKERMLLRIRNNKYDLQ